METRAFNNMIEDELERNNILLIDFLSRDKIPDYVFLGSIVDTEIILEIKFNPVSYGYIYFFNGVGYLMHFNPNEITSDCKTKVERDLKLRSICLSEYAQVVIDNIRILGNRVVLSMGCLKNKDFENHFEKWRDMNKLSNPFTTGKLYLTKGDQKTVLDFNSRNILFLDKRK